MNGSLEELFRRHAAQVLAYALRRTDEASAHDVVSEVFLVAGRRPGRVPDHDPHLWLYAVARRVLANQRRAQRRRAALSAVLGDRAAPTAAPGPRTGSPLLEALARIPAADREVLLLTAWEGLDAEETAAVLGCSRAAVHTRLYRARTRLQAELDAEDRPSPALPEASR